MDAHHPARLVRHLLVVRDQNDGVPGIGQPVEPRHHLGLQPVTHPHLHGALPLRAIFENLGLEGVAVGRGLQLRQRYHQRIAGRGRHEEHPCRHLRHQRAVGIVHIEQRRIGHHLARRRLGAAFLAPSTSSRRHGLVGRCRQHLPQRALPAARLALRVHQAHRREIHRHVHLHATDVGLRHLRPHRHAGKVRNAHHHRCLVGRIQRLPFPGIQCHHRAGHRRIDARMPQLRLAALQARGCAFDLCRQALHPRLRNLQVGLGRLEILHAGRTVFMKFVKHLRSSGYDLPVANHIDTHIR